ncbi:MAG: hypothetical protein A2679_03250 [Candidatus Sungbacteria bacterium RIFCSPHIGHO2_01_FULL_54_26]|nr:MAG: hypothetical protein A2679_03250 [Candidatus Sungbacteria bacterium RIFCSPHIGHO2_01_FULL_54_26]
MKISYYGYDNVFKALFPLVIKEAEGARGHEQGVWLPPQVRDVAAERKNEVLDCDVVLLGLSSFQTQEEMTVIGTCRRVVIIADCPGSELRPKAQTWVREQAALPRRERKLKGLLLALESSRQKAIEFGYPPEDIHFVGVPPHWGISYRQMKEIDVPAVRARLSEGFLVFVPGGKNPLLTNTLLRHSIVAGREVIGEQFLLGFAPHPGEKPENWGEVEIFARAFAERTLMLDGLRMADMTPFTNPERYAIADIVITTGGPTETIAAAYARNTNIVYYRDNVVRKVLAESGVENGDWFVPDYGGAHLAGPDDFLDVVRFAMSPDGKERLLRTQEKSFPLPETWDTAPAIVDVLERVARE